MRLTTRTARNTGTGALLSAVALAAATALLAPQAGARQKPQARQTPQISEQRPACRDNLRQLAIAMMMYVQDNDEKFPPMQSAAQVQNRLRPYVKKQDAFYCPVTRQPYQPVKALSGKPLPALEVPKAVRMLVEGRAHPDGTENIAYADGHVKGK